MRHHGQVLYFNPHHLCGVDENIELPNKRVLPVWSGTRSWHLKMMCCTSEESSQILGKLIWWEWGTMKRNFPAIPYLAGNHYQITLMERGELTL